MPWCRPRLAGQISVSVQVLCRSLFFRRNRKQTRFFSHQEFVCCSLFFIQSIVPISLKQIIIFLKCWLSVVLQLINISQQAFSSEQQGWQYIFCFSEIYPGWFGCINRSLLSTDYFKRNSTIKYSRSYNFFFFIFKVERQFCNPRFQRIFTEQLTSQ